MLQTLKLLLPALIPSWRFFDTITPSPRIEFTLLKTAKDATGSWQEFRPRPLPLSLSRMLKHLLWNPLWNESLFLVSCAEKIVMTPDAHSIHEIFRRITADLERRSIDATATPYLQFRLAFLGRQGDELQKHILFVSPVYPLGGNTVS